jgi:hypothetical protein
MNQFGDAYKKLEALGDRERVLAVWPDAKLVGYHDGACAVYTQMATETGDTGYVGWGQTTFNRNSTQAQAEAWADAASRLPVVAEPAAEGAGGERPLARWCAEEAHYLDALGQCYNCAYPDRYARPFSEPPVAEPAKGEERRLWITPCEHLNIENGKAACLQCANPPQPAMPEALVTDQEIATRLRDSGDTCMCIDCRFARELQAWRAWAKSGGSR